VLLVLLSTFARLFCLGQTKHGLVYSHAALLGPPACRPCMRAWLQLQLARPAHEAARVLRRLSLRLLLLSTWGDVGLPAAVGWAMLGLCALAWVEQAGPATGATAMQAMALLPSPTQQQVECRAMTPMPVPVPSLLLLSATPAAGAGVLLSA
jgi:hypothetical protein